MEARQGAKGGDVEVFFWLYVSRSVIPKADTEQVIGEIVRGSQDRNRALHITGALAYSDRNFGQIVECQTALKIGSDAVLMMVTSGRSDEPGLQQVELSATVHLSFDQLQFGYLALGLAVRPARDDGGADGGDIPVDAVGERGDQAGPTALDPRTQIGLGLAADHNVEGRDDLACFDQ